MGQMQGDAVTVSAQIERWSVKIDELAADAGEASTGLDMAPMVRDCVPRCTEPRGGNGAFADEMQSFGGEG
jgi:hypothetical protein